MAKKKAPKKEPVKKKSQVNSSPHWDLDIHGISYSSLARFLNCRERYRIYSVEGMKPVDTTDSLDFGTIFHKLLEWKAQGLKNLKPKLLQWCRDLGKKDTYILLAEQAYLVYEFYCSVWEGNDVSRKYIMHEQDFEVEVPLGTHAPVRLIGRIDEAFMENGKLWLQENKTKSRIDPNIAETLPFDLQTQIYIYALSKSYPQYKFEGVLYNIIRKPELRRGVKETEVQFLNRIKKDIESREEHYFIRHRVEFTQKDIDDFVKQTLVPNLIQLRLWWESIKHDPFNPWTLEDGSPNHHHFLRPIGVYDSFRYNPKGDYFDYITKGVTIGLRKVERNEEEDE